MYFIFCGFGKGFSCHLKGGQLQMLLVGAGDVGVPEFEPTSPTKGSTAWQQRWASLGFVECLRTEGFFRVSEFLAESQKSQLNYMYIYIYVWTCYFFEYTLSMNFFFVCIIHLGLSWRQTNDVSCDHNSCPDPRPTACSSLSRSWERDIGRGRPQ